MYKQHPPRCKRGAGGGLLEYAPAGARLYRVP